MRRRLAALVLLPAALHAPGAPRLAPVPEAQRTDEPRAIAAGFADGGMANAVATRLAYPALARRVFAHDRYLTTQSTLPRRA